MTIRLPLSMLMSALVLWGGYVAWALHGENDRNLFPDLVLEPDPLDWMLIEGEGSLSVAGMAIHEPNDRGRWVLAIRLPTPIRAERYDQIQVHSGNANHHRPLAINWSHSSHYLPSHSLPLSRSTDGQFETRLRGLPGWQDQIYFVGLESLGALGSPLYIQSIRLRQAESDFFSLHTRLAEDWLAFPPWTQQSINFTTSSPQPGPISLLLVVLSWVIGSCIFLLALSARRLHQTWPWLAVPIIAGWLLLDLRWQMTMFANSGRAIQQLASMTVDEKRAHDQDADLYQFLSELPDLTSAEFSGRIFAIGQHDYWRTRARYHLLPLSVRTADISDWDVDAVSAMQPGDVILVFDGAAIPYRSMEQAPYVKLFAIGDAETFVRAELLAEQGDFKGFRVVESAPSTTP